MICIVYSFTFFLLRLWSLKHLQFGTVHSLYEKLIQIINTEFGPWHPKKAYARERLWIWTSLASRYILPCLHLALPLFLLVLLVLQELKHNEEGLELKKEQVFSPGRIIASSFLASTGWFWPFVMANIQTWIFMKYILGLFMNHLFLSTQSYVCSLIKN